MKNFIGILVSFAYIAVLMISAKYYEKFDKEGSRKFIHILLANWWLIIMAFLDNLVWAIIPPIAFVIINFISYKSNVIKVMERDEDEKDGLGTVYYAFSLIPLVILSFGLTDNRLIGLLGMFMMAYGDGFASLVGREIKSKSFTILGTKKTIAGCLTMFAISFIIALAVFAISNSSLYGLKALGLAVLATILEAVSVKGTDNLTVPILTSLITYFII